MEPITIFTAKAVALPLENVDTDQIIPARWLKVTDKTDLADGLFEALRYNADGTLNPEFPLNRPEAIGAQVLIAGNNFGCGSSREHAPWALQGYGFRAVISTDFADIFRNNSLKNGLLPIIVDEETYYQLVSMVEEDPSTQISVDLLSQSLGLPDGRQVGFPIDSFARYCLLNGVDQIGFLLSRDAATAAYEQHSPIQINTQAG